MPSARGTGDSPRLSSARTGLNSSPSFAASHFDSERGCVVPTSCSTSLQFKRFRVSTRCGSCFAHSPGVWTFSAGLNPERMRSLSPGLRAARYPGWRWVGASTLEGVASFVPFTPVNPTHPVRPMPIRTASAIAGTHPEWWRRRDARESWPMIAAWGREWTGRGGDATLTG